MLTCRPVWGCSGCEWPCPEWAGSSLLCVPEVSAWQEDWPQHLTVHKITSLGKHQTKSWEVSQPGSHTNRNPKKHCDRLLQIKVPFPGTPVFTWILNLWMRHRNSRNPQLFKEMQPVTQRKSESAVFLEPQKNKFRPGEQRSVLTLLIFIFSYQLLQLFSFLLLHLLLPVLHVKLRGAKTLISVCFTFSSPSKTCLLFHLNPHRSKVRLLKLHLRYTWADGLLLPFLPPHKTNSPLPPRCTLYCS